GKRLAERIAVMSEFLKINDLLQKMTGTLPWGWQQRVALAAANLHQPQILFLDEPTGSVDPVSRRNFWDLIQALSRQGTTIFVTTHHLDEAEYCHRISIMVNGRMAVLDTPAAIKRSAGSASLHDAFVKLVDRGGQT
ncbi:MAG: ATP-binding cassette domain-containing protein, partial [Chitinivibrionales bacterium]|nr:ATP-binding cassette domain-containing protein [Chitinivibrionales bacterium]